MGDKTKYVLLAHLSEKNNTPEKALEAMINEEIDKQAKVLIASQYEMSEILEV